MILGGECEASLLLLFFWLVFEHLRDRPANEGGDGVIEVNDIRLSHVPYAFQPRCHFAEVELLPKGNECPVSTHVRL